MMSWQVPLAGRLDDQLAEPRRGAGIALGLDGDDLDAVPVVVTQLQIHTSSGRHARLYLGRPSRTNGPV
jgi:hypothetical protein